MDMMKRQRKIPKPGSYYDRVWTLARDEGMPFKDAERIITLRRAKMAYDMKWRKVPGGRIASLMNISRVSVTRLINRWQAHLDEQ